MTGKQRGDVRREFNGRDSGGMPELPPDAFRKDDGGDDAAFYAPARLVTHIDEAATFLLEASCSTSCRAGSAICRRR